MPPEKISVVIPAYNEEKSIPELYYELSTVLETLEKPYEIIFVDDGSTDSTFNLLEDIHDRDKKVKVVRFRRNFGKSNALSQGFRHAEGDIIITMDADLQDDPQEIPKFLEELKKGEHELVVGWKFNRKDPLTKRIPSKIFNSLVRRFTGIKIHDSNCCFKAYKKEVVRDINLYGELHRYIPTLAHWKGYRVVEIKVNHRPRLHGKSKYGFLRLVNGMLDLITVKFLTTYATIPLHFFGTIGMLFTFFGTITGAYLLFVKYFLGQLIGGRPLLFAGILMIIVGIQFFSIGLIGDMIASSRGVKEYPIKEILE